MDEQMYHPSSKMGGDGAEDGSDVGEDDGDEDGDEDKNMHAVNLFFFFPVHMH